MSNCGGNNNNCCRPPATGQPIGCSDLDCRFGTRGFTPFQENGGGCGNNCSNRGDCSNNIKCCGNSNSSNGSCCSNGGGCNNGGCLNECGGGGRFLNTPGGGGIGTCSNSGCNNNNNNSGGFCGASSGDCGSCQYCGGYGCNCCCPLGCSDLGHCSPSLCIPRPPPQTRKCSTPCPPLPCCGCCTDQRAHHLNRSPYCCPCRPCPDACVYRCCEGMSTSYAGHIPGFTFHSLGRTSPKASFGTKNYMQCCLYYNTWSKI